MLDLSPHEKERSGKDHEEQDRHHTEAERPLQRGQPEKGEGGTEDEKKTSAPKTSVFRRFSKGDGSHDAEGPEDGEDNVCCFIHRYHLIKMHARQ